VTSLRFVSWCIASLGLGACYPSPAHLHCLDECHAENDRCVLAAQDAASVQACDQAVQLCLARCPP
jgi:hypothetical protein